MFYQGGEIPHICKLHWYILGKNHYAHTRAYDTSDGLLAHIHALIHALFNKGARYMFYQGGEIPPYVNYIGI